MPANAIAAMNATLAITTKVFTRHLIFDSPNKHPPSLGGSSETPLILDPRHRAAYP